MRSARTWNCLCGSPMSHASVRNGARAEGAEGENVILRGRVENWERENLEARSLAQRESVRADTAERNGTEFRAQAEAEATELRRKIAVLTETSEALRSRLTDDEATDHITARIPTYGPAILPHEFAAICEDYAALRSISGRTRVSRQLLQAVISNPPLAAVLSGPGTPDSLKSHELHRQMEASLAFAAGRLQDAEHGFRALCTDLPSPFNFECSARTHLANNNQRDAFAALTDGTDRFPTDTALNRAVGHLLHSDRRRGSRQCGPRRGEAQVRQSKLCT